MEDSTNEIVWIYGSSAVGKETFIKHIIEKAPSELVTKLMWTDKKIVPCNESVEWVAQYENDPKGKLRNNIPQVVKKILSGKRNVVVLIKGQDTDLVQNMQIILKKEVPNCKHRIIFLNANADTLLDRIQVKSWWKDENANKDDLVRWVVYQIRHLLTLKNDFTIDVVQSNNNKKYNLTSRTLENIHKDFGYADLSKL